MDSLFKAEDNNSIQERINKLTPDSKPLWGTMNVSQMLAHLQPTMQMCFGELRLKKKLISFFIGKSAKKKIISEEPFQQNIPTLKEFKIAEKDFEIEKKPYFLMLIVSKQEEQKL